MMSWVWLDLNFEGEFCIREKVSELKNKMDPPLSSPQFFVSFISFYHFSTFCALLENRLVIVGNNKKSQVEKIDKGVEGVVYTRKREIIKKKKGMDTLPGSFYAGPQKKFSHQNEI